LLSRRLDALEGYLAKLESFRPVPREEFVEESTLHDLAERYLQLACECVADIGQHLISDLGFRHAESYRDVIAVLQEEGILEDDLAKSLKGWMGLRNVLVHIYLKIDHGKTYDTIETELEDLERFAQAVARLLRGTPEDEASS
jgi:uncharacterized protein YutE (UPF0331/DUF86 family)